MTKFKSPLRYPGGKSRHIEHLAPLLPERIGEYREPFAGGASMFFHMRSNDLAKKYWINDAFHPLANFWAQAKNKEANDIMCEDAYAMLNHPPDAIRAFAEAARRRLEKPEQDENWRAYAFFYYIVNRCSFSGSTLCGGFSPGNTRFIRSSVDNLKACREALKGVRISNCDFSGLIIDPGEDVFLFCDPPYISAKKLYGKKGDMHDNFDHLALGELLRKTGHYWMLTYDDDPVIRGYYRDFNIREIDVTNSMNNCGKDGKQKRVKELVITNYE